MLDKVEIVGTYAMLFFVECSAELSWNKRFPQGLPLECSATFVGLFFSSPTSIGILLIKCL